MQTSARPRRRAEELCLPEQPQLGQQGWVGAALLRAGLTRRVMLGAETPDLCQDLPGESRKNTLVSRELESEARRSGKMNWADLLPLAFSQEGGENEAKKGLIKISAANLQAKL